MLIQTEGSDVMLQSLEKEDLAWRDLALLSQSFCTVGTAGSTSSINRAV